VEADFTQPIPTQPLFCMASTLDKTTLATDEALHLTLYWQALQPPPGNYLVTLRLVDSKGPGRRPSSRGAGGSTLTQPLHGLPMMWWPIFIPCLSIRPLHPAIYHLQVSLAPPFSQSALTLPDGRLG